MSIAQSSAKQAIVQLHVSYDAKKILGYFIVLKTMWFWVCD